MQCVIGIDACIFLQAHPAHWLEPADGMGRHIACAVDRGRTGRLWVSADGGV